MKPKAKTIKMIRWECGIIGHNHKTEKVAQACIDSQQRKRQNASLKRSEEECLEILRRFESGERVCDLMRDTGRTRYQIKHDMYIGRRIRERQQSNNPMYELPARCRNALCRAGLRTPHQVQQAIVSGQKMKFRNFGNVSLQIVIDWLRSLKYMVD